jgi:hypothetical protein
MYGKEAAKHREENRMVARQPKESSKQSVCPSILFGASEKI